jgi:ABC-type dipeptide/oligopeptide/nickel transport system permease component
VKLWAYVLRRLILLIPTLIGLTFLVFALEHVGGANQFLQQYINPHLQGTARTVLVNELTQRFHLNDPVYVQYVYWLAAILKGDWGTSSSPGFTGVPVTTVFVWFMPNTIMITTLASVLTWVISIPIGVYSAARRDSMLDQSVRVATFTLYSMPIFLIGFLLFLGLGGWALPDVGNLDGTLYLSLSGQPWFDSSFSVSYPTHVLTIDALLNGNLSVAWNSFLHALLPSFSLTLALLAGIIRILRASMLETLEQDYIRLARAKGVSNRIVNNLHAKKNALLPTITSFGYLVSFLLGGAVVIEDIYTYKGIGFVTTQAFLNQDAGVVMGSTLAFGLILVFTTLILDLLYAFLDPRIRYE